MIPRWWNLVIVFSAFMIQLITFGVAGAIGLYNIEFLDYFKVPVAELSLIGSINIGVFLGAGPLVSLLMRYISYRNVVILGSLISTASLLCIPFLNSIIFMYIVYGVVAGVGFAMAYLPSSVLAGLYFDKHRSLATGIVTSGSGLGGMLFPILVHYLIEYYGWKGSMFILAGLMLQCVVLGALLFPLEEKLIKEETRKELIHHDEFETGKANCKNGTSNSNNEKIENGRNDSESMNDGHACVNETDKMLERTDEVKTATKSDKNLKINEVPLKHCYVLCDFSFFIFFLNNILWNMGTVICWVLGPEYYVNMGLTKGNAATILTVSGIGCFIGSIIGGGLGNIKRLNRLGMYIIWNVLVGVFTLLLPVKIFQTVYILSSIMFLSGLAFGGILGLLVIFTVDLLGEKALGDAFGYLMLSNGVGAMLGPPLGGYLKDEYGTFDLTFYLSGSLIVVGGLMMLLIPVKNQLTYNKKKTIELTIDVNNSSDV